MSDPISKARKAVWHLRHGGIEQYREYRRRVRFGESASPSTHLKNPPAIHPYEPQTVTPRRSIRVGVILDEFSALALSYEWIQVMLTPSTWESQLDSIDMLFVESAWHGNKDTWQYQLVGSKAPSLALQNLVAACQTRGIPTVFWNKEDPFHFEDFIDTAKLFDWVFTTDTALVEKYKLALGHNQVGVMMFGAQPHLHNPFGRPNEEQLRDVCFAGTYFSHKFPERAQQISVLLGGISSIAARLPRGLDIYSRFSNDEKYRFPAPLDTYVRGELDYSRMLNAYRQYKCFVNVNSIVDSATMFSRRVFEIVCCGGAVISAPSPGIEAIFGSSVIQTDDAETAGYWARALCGSAALRDELAHTAAMLVLEKHTYKHRIDDVLETIGLSEYVVGAPKVSVLAATKRPHQLDHLLHQVARQQAVEIELLICTHGFEASPEQKALAESLCLNTIWVTADPSASLGENYNRLIAMASMPYVAKMDDDDDYGKYYLLEQLNAAEVTGAAIVGKATHFLALPIRGIGRLMLMRPNRENKPASFVAGPTLVINTDFAREHPFPCANRGEDTAMLKAAHSSGEKVISTSRFEFTQNRTSTDHTWSISEPQILSQGQLIETNSAT